MYLSILYIVLLFIRAPFYVLLVFVGMCSVFWFFWLSCQYLPSAWLERPLWGNLTMARGTSPVNPGRRVLIIFLVHCIVSWFYYVSLLSRVPMWYISYYYGTIYPIGAESAIKQQTNKHWHSAALRDVADAQFWYCVLGTSYLQQFCTSIVNAIVSPFVLLDIAMEAATFLAANSVSQVAQQIRLPLLNSLLQKCLQM